MNLREPGGAGPEGHLTPGKGGVRAAAGAAAGAVGAEPGFHQVQERSLVLLLTSASEPRSSCVLDGDQDVVTTRGNGDR